jgi:AAA+ ATPase superfamily predicted ATPase
MFVGRKNEIEELERLIRKKTSSLVTITGRRRIGKSRLIEEIAQRNQNYRLLNFSGLAPGLEKSNTSQKENFALRLQQLFHIPPVDHRDWTFLFEHLAQHCKEGRFILLLDEISWMGHGDSDFLGKLKNAWDMSLKQNPDLILVLCGSVSSWIEKNILSSTGFMGRVSLRLKLDELSLSDSSHFFNDKGAHWSAYEKFKTLAITGGVPRYLEEILLDISAEENIRRLCYSKEGILFNEYDDIFHDLFGKNEGYYTKIVEFLSNGSKTILDLCEHLGVNKNGRIIEHLNDLVQSGFVSRNYTWNLKNSNPSKLSQFKLKDNYLRFYLRCIKGHRHQIESGAFQNKSQTTLPGWESIMGLQFENLVINNRTLLWENLSINPGDIVNDGPYFQTKTKLRQGCQIDYLVQSKYGTLHLVEIKFSRKPLGRQVIKEIQERIASLSKSTHQSIIPVLVHVNGVEESVLEADIFARIIDFSKMLES